MQLSDQQKFMEILTGVAEMYNKTLSPIQLEVYWNALAEFELGDLNQVFVKHVKNPDGGQFMPKPADIIKLLEGGGQSKAQLAWSKVHQAMQRIGRYQSVVFDDPIIHAVINDMDGWINLCGVNDKELPFKAREFEQRYADYVLKPPVDYPKQLCGLTEQHNSAHGHEEQIPKAQLIGNSQKALEVMAKGNEDTFVYQSLLDAVKQQQALANATSAQTIAPTSNTPWLEHKKAVNGEK